MPQEKAPEKKKDNPTAFDFAKEFVTGVYGEKKEKKHLQAPNQVTGPRG